MTVRTLFAAAAGSPAPAHESANSVVGIATVNAAIVAVFFGALTAYAVVIAQRIHEMTDEVLASARRVNDLDPVGALWEDEEMEKLLVHGAPSREELGRRLTAASHQIRWERVLATESGEDRPFDERDLDNRVVASLKCACLMELLGARYPFPTSLDARGQWLHPSARQPLMFNRHEDAQRWARDMIRFVERLERIVTAHHGRLHVLMSSWDQGLGRLRAVLPAEIAGDAEYALSATDPAQILDRFEDKLVEAKRIARETIRRWEALNVYSRARLSRENLRAASVAALVATVVLAAGVLVPMVHETAPRWLVAWLPATVYVFVVGVGLVMLVRRWLAT